ncbi:DUF4278 domain-containing protein [Kovacikia minuta CCNUW1]|uniref:arginine synthesis PII-interacting regulator PirA n=1 Tax=Kovacikia minuta TaxID=2931930 RepID=UPI001CCCA346|nr:DUF4278 domain-containing protein [Kovacikia minuta]UBF28086.1 DUF4278 domain-containing protein [Kovacikia minuta CCNUW1]
MKLSYRGVNYEFTPPSLEVTEGEILGKYRGVNWRCHTLQETPIPQINQTLTYRGVSYGPNRVNNQVPTMGAQAGSTRTLKPVVPKAFPVRKQAEEVHRANLLRNLERRLQVAKERGDQNLISLLEAESRQIVGL